MRRSDPSQHRHAELSPPCCLKLSLLGSQMRLGNSSCSPTIAGLVLEHLCPSIQNILEDGLRDHKLDLIIGQRRNHPWSVVEVSARTGKCHQTLFLLVYQSVLEAFVSNSRSVHKGPSQAGV